MLLLRIRNAVLFSLAQTSTTSSICCSMWIEDIKCFSSCASWLAGVSNWGCKVNLIRSESDWQTVLLLSIRDLWEALKVSNQTTFKKKNRQDTMFFCFFFFPKMSSGWSGLIRECQKEIIKCQAFAQFLLISLRHHLRILGTCKSRDRWLLPLRSALGLLLHHSTGFNVKWHRLSLL